ncbi:MAG: AAA family ATPase [Verrucomicrobia bacterium]|nr:AAA family ATPase [Verrucomicrobiota bacterium]
MTHPVTIRAEMDCGLFSDLWATFAESPYHRIFAETDDRAIDHLAEVYASRRFRGSRRRKGQALVWTQIVFRFSADCFVWVRGNGVNNLGIYAADQEQADAVYREIRAALDQLPKSEDKPSFQLLRFEDNEFVTEQVDEVLPDPGDEFVTLSYGADALEWIQQFHDRTTGQVGGLTLLDGPPGTGKTSFIALLIQRLRSSHVFYNLPTSRDDAFTSPELIPFWRGENERRPDRVKVIVLEDAELMLWSSRGETREAVSALLNIADGLAGRMLKLHLLCTMNGRREAIDPALLRPGRLRCERRFEPLPRGTAERVAAIRGLTLDPTDARELLPLSDVLNPGSRAAFEPKRIGF